MSNDNNHEIVYTLKLQDKLSTAYKKASTAVASSTKAISASASSTSAKVSTSVTKIIARFKSMRVQIDNTSKKVRGNLQKLSSSIMDSSGKFGQLFSGIAKSPQALVALTAVVVTVGALALAYNKAWEAGTAFQSSQSKLSAITQASTQDMAKLTQQAKYLGESTKYTAVESSEAFTEMAKLGLKTNDIIASSSAVLDLASLSQSDMATSATVAVSTLKQFNLSADQSTRVVDVMAKSFTSTALDMTKYAESMKYVGPVANSLDVSLETTTAMLGTLADRAIDGSQAGTAMRTMMLMLGDSSSKAGKLLDKAGLSSATMTEKLKGLKAMNLSVAETTDLFGRNASTAVGVLIEGAGAVEGLDTALQNAKGSASKMSSEMMDNADGALALFDSRLEGVAQQLFLTFGDEGTDLIKFFTNKLEWLATAVEENKEALKATAIVIKELTIGLVNFVMSIVDVIKLAVNAVAGSIMVILGGLAKGIQEALNLAIYLVNKARTALGFDPIEIDLKFGDIALGAGLDVFKDDVANNASAIYDRYTTGNEATTNKTKAVDVEASGSIGSSAGMPDDLTGAQSDEGAKAKAKAREASYKKALKLHTKLNEAIALSDKTADEKAIIRINQKYDAQKELLESHGIDIANNELLRTDELNALKQEKLAQAVAFEKQIKDEAVLQDLEARGANSEIELIQLTAQYDKKLELAKQHGVALEEVESMKAKAITALNDKYALQREQTARAEANTRIEVMTDLYSGIGALLVQGTKDAEKQAKLQKTISIGEAIINTYSGANKALASTPYPYNFVAMASVIAGGLANVAQISAQKFADGGIVGGTSYYGDRVNALVNSGEMVLNRRQQSNLFKLANSNTVPSNNNTNNSNTVIQGGAINLTVHEGASANDIVGLVDEAVGKQNINLARMLRENQEIGVTA